MGSDRAEVGEEGGVDEARDDYDDDDMLGGTGGSRASFSFPPPWESFVSVVSYI